MSSAQAQDIEKAAFDQKISKEEEATQFEKQRQETYKAENSIEVHDQQQVPERTISDQHPNIFDAQQAYDDLALHENAHIQTPTASPAPLGNLTTYLTARMYIPTHLFLLVILILFIESAALFAYTTIGLLKSFPGAVPFGSFPGEGRCHCSPQNYIGEPGPAMQPFVVNVAPNIAVGAGAPLVPFDNAGPRVPIPVSIPTAMTLPGIFAAPSESPLESIPSNPTSAQQRQSTTFSSSATAISEPTKPTGTLPGLLPNLISDLVAKHSSTSSTTTQAPSATRAAVTELILSTTTLPPSVSKSASVVTKTTVVAPSSSSAA